MNQAGAKSNWKTRGGRGKSFYDRAGKFSITYMTIPDGKALALVLLSAGLGSFDISRADCAVPDGNSEGIVTNVGAGLHERTFLKA